MLMQLSAGKVAFTWRAGGFKAVSAQVAITA
jgi:hypothetical protein